MMDKQAEADKKKKERLKNQIKKDNKELKRIEIRDTKRGNKRLNELAPLLNDFCNFGFSSDEETLSNVSQNDFKNYKSNFETWLAVYKQSYERLQKITDLLKRNGLYQGQEMGEIDNKSFNNFLNDFDNWLHQR